MADRISALPSPGGARPFAGNFEGRGSVNLRIVIAIDAIADAGLDAVLDAAVDSHGHDALRHILAPGAAPPWPIDFATPSGSVSGTGADSGGRSSIGAG